MATIISILTLALPTQITTAVQHHPKHHVRPAVHHVHRHHHRRHRHAGGQITKFDICVANRENGEPGSLDPKYIHWFAVNGYYGAYSFLHETWREAGGERYAYNANEASPTEQSKVFNDYEPSHPGAWPNTVPPCLIYK